jgi:hypothetical protein
MPTEVITGSSSAIHNMTERLVYLKPPEELRVRVLGHIAYLHKLAESLSTIGLDENTIDKHLLELFEQYEEQLRQAMSAYVPSEFEAPR